MDVNAYVRRVALILGLSLPAYSAALADGRAVLPPRWMVDAHLSGAAIKPSRDDIARAIIPGMAAAAGARTASRAGPPFFVGAGSVGVHAGTVGIPAGVVAGDTLLLLAHSLREGPGQVDPGPLEVAGWMPLLRVGDVATNSSGWKSSYEIFIKIATGSDVAPSPPAGNSSTDRQCFIILAFRNAPFIEALTGVSNAGATLNIPNSNLATLGADRFVVENYFITKSGTSPVTGTPPAGWTELADVWNGDTRHIGLQSDGKFFASAGSTGSTLRSVNAAISDYGRISLAFFNDASYDADAIALFARMAVQPSTARKAIINRIINLLKATGIWSKLDFLYVFDADNQADALLNWRGSSYNATLSGSPTFTVDRGFKTNGGSGQVFGPNPTTVGGQFTLNSAHFSGWTRAANRTYNGWNFGGDASTPYNLCMMRDTSNRGQYYINGISFNGITNTVMDSKGFHVVNRSGSSAQQAYKDGLQVASSTAAGGTLLNSQLRWIGAWNASTDGDEYIMASGGGSLSASQQRAFYHIMHLWHDHVGAL